jgi:2-polyprenyl-6-methoxyphenol hydroxylase-like FAD-dependent oxidoreductase
MFDLVPEFAERVRGARRAAPFAGAAVTNFFRKPYGPGWALVGDAGYNKDPITAQGINDAFRDAELLATASDEALTGRRSFADAMGDYQRTRDQHVRPMYEFTCQLATSNHRRQKCKSCSARSTATRRRWMALSR